MKHLNEYVETKNSWGAWFKHKPIDLSTYEGRLRVAQSVAGEMSPEHLTCDGELRGDEVQRRAKYLRAVARELIELDDSFEHFDFYLL